MVAVVIIVIVLQVLVTNIIRRNRNNCSNNKVNSNTWKKQQTNNNRAMVDKTLQQSGDIGRHAGPSTTWTMQARPTDVTNKKKMRNANENA